MSPRTTPRINHKMYMAPVPPRDRPGPLRWRWVWTNRRSECGQNVKSPYHVRKWSERGGDGGNQPVSWALIWFSSGPAISHPPHASPTCCALRWTQRRILIQEAGSLSSGCSRRFTAHPSPRVREAPSKDGLIVVVLLFVALAVGYASLVWWGVVRH